METLIDSYIPRYIEKYSKFHIFTAGAKKVMLQYSWEGNRVQLERFCERMVLTAGKRTITDSYVAGLLEELYGNGELGQFVTDLTWYLRNLQRNRDGDGFPGAAA